MGIIKQLLDFSSLISDLLVTITLYCARLLPRPYQLLMTDKSDIELVLEISAVKVEELCETNSRFSSFSEKILSGDFCL